MSESTNGNNTLDRPNGSSRLAHSSSSSSLSFGVGSSKSSLSPVRVSGGLSPSQAARRRARIASLDRAWRHNTLKESIRPSFDASFPMRLNKYVGQQLVPLASQVTHNATTTMPTPMVNNNNNKRNTTHLPSTGSHSPYRSRLGRSISSDVLSPLGVRSNPSGATSPDRDRRSVWDEIPLGRGIALEGEDDPNANGQQDEDGPPVGSIEKFLKVSNQLHQSATSATLSAASNNNNANNKMKRPPSLHRDPSTASLVDSTVVTPPSHSHATPTRVPPKLAPVTTPTPNTATGKQSSTPSSTSPQHRKKQSWDWSSPKFLPRTEKQILIEQQASHPKEESKESQKLVPIGPSSTTFQKLLGPSTSDSKYSRRRLNGSSRNSPVRQFQPLPSDEKFRRATEPIEPIRLPISNPQAGPTLKEYHAALHVLDGRHSRAADHVCVPLPREFNRVEGLLRQGTLDIYGNNKKTLEAIRLKRARARATSLQMGEEAIARKHADEAARKDGWARQEEASQIELQRRKQLEHDARAKIIAAQKAAKDARRRAEEDAAREADLRSLHEAFSTACSGGFQNLLSGELRESFEIKGPKVEWLGVFLFEMTQRYHQTVDEMLDMIRGMSLASFKVSNYSQLVSTYLGMLEESRRTILVAAERRKQLRQEKAIAASAAAAAGVTSESNSSREQSTPMTTPSKRTNHDKHTNASSTPNTATASKTRTVLRTKKQSHAAHTVAGDSQDTSPLFTRPSSHTTNHDESVDGDSVVGGAGGVRSSRLSTQELVDLLKDFDDSGRPIESYSQLLEQLQTPQALERIDAIRKTTSTTKKSHTDVDDGGSSTRATIVVDPEQATKALQKRQESKNNTTANISTTNDASVNVTQPVVETPIAANEAGDDADADIPSADMAADENETTPQPQPESVSTDAPVEEQTHPVPASTHSTPRAAAEQDQTPPDENAHIEPMASSDGPAGSASESEPNPTVAGPSVATQSNSTAATVSTVPTTTSAAEANTAPSTQPTTLKPDDTKANKVDADNEAEAKRKQGEANATKRKQDEAAKQKQAEADAAELKRKQDADAAAAAAAESARQQAESDAKRKQADAAAAAAAAEAKRKQDADDAAAVAAALAESKRKEDEANAAAAAAAALKHKEADAAAAKEKEHADAKAAEDKSQSDKESPPPTSSPLSVVASQSVGLGTAFPPTSPLSPEEAEAVTLAARQAERKKKKSTSVPPATLLAIASHELEVQLTARSRAEADQRQRQEAAAHQAGEEHKVKTTESQAKSLKSEQDDTSKTNDAEAASRQQSTATSPQVQPATTPPSDNVDSNATGPASNAQPAEVSHEPHADETPHPVESNDPLPPPDGMTREDCLHQANELMTQVTSLMDGEHFEDALPLAERELELREVGYGRTLDIRLLHSLENCATLYEVLHQSDESLPFLFQTLQILSSQHGRRHPSVADALVRMGEALVAVQEGEDAFNVFTRAYLIRKQALGSEHEETIKARQAIIALTEPNFAVDELTLEEIPLLAGEADSDLVVGGVDVVDGGVPSLDPVEVSSAEHAAASVRTKSASLKRQPQSQPPLDGVAPSPTPPNEYEEDFPDPDQVGLEPSASQ